ncbi:DUF4148 domain-containing protein [Paraburkholderia solisilvae]|uniref:DUF4148 domain-containing protein n=1 Tax=Paraburkholderia solisilvae TaxID=624376 RepID=A0A6J5E1N2_9BURK|nr:DUF4148 domain-containing protein [Paraburkholderia solisilvae]CAB3760348.1 hypothetical protein LMG29739_03361 [Paraburkholderia solisilvae]
MKSLIKAVALAAVLATPVVSFAQSSVTRDQVRAELAQVQKAEQTQSLYDAGDAHYPDGIQHAEQRANAQNATAQAAAQTTAYGPATNGTSQSGASNAHTGNDWLGSAYARP